MFGDSDVDDGPDTNAATGVNDNEEMDIYGKQFNEIVIEG